MRLGEYRPQDRPAWLERQELYSRDLYPDDDPFGALDQQPHPVPHSSSGVPAADRASRPSGAHGPDGVPPRAVGSTASEDTP